MKCVQQAAIVISAALLAAAAAYPVRADAQGDRSPEAASRFEWGWVYGSITNLVRDSDPFPWNDPPDDAYIADRLAALLLWSSSGGSALFLKGSSAAAEESSVSAHSAFALEQGHLLLETNLISARLFSRERVFGSSNRVLPLVSNDAPLISRGGDGVALRLSPAEPLGVSYTGAVLGKDRTAAGFPAPTGAGGTRFNQVAIDMLAGSWRAGLLLSDTRGRDGDNTVLFGLSCVIPVGKALCIAEYARSAAGDWSDLGRKRLLGLEARRARRGRISEALSPEAALKIEVLGLETADARLGRFGLVPGYHYAGEGLINRQGEVRSGVVESYATCWWRHPTLAAMLTAEVGERYHAATGEGGGVLGAAFHARLRGGLQTREAVLFRAGQRPALILSLLDDNDLRRVSATARIDEAGGTNRFSYLTEAAVNLGRGVTAGGTLLLDRSTRGLYSVDIEIRQGRRFLARASFGSYIPGYEYVPLNYGPDPAAVEDARHVSLQARLAFGRI